MATDEVGQGMAVEKELADRIREHRGRMSYKQLADRMEAAGCAIYPSAIQRTEKSGRRITVDELVAYSRVFDVSTSALLGEAPPEGTDELWGMYIGLERLAAVNRVVQNQYADALGEMRSSVQDKPKLVKMIQDRHDSELGVQERRARRDAANDGEDVSTARKLDVYMKHWGHLDVPALTAARDVLEGVDNGEGK